jgi:ribonuclease HI
MAMELEAALAPPKARFNRICRNYAARILQMPKNHALRTRVSSSFPPYNIGCELDWTKYLDWNEKEQEKNLVIRKKSKKIVSQLFKITGMISHLLPSLKIEKIKQKWNAPWNQDLESLMKIEISELDKEKTAVIHYNKIQKILAKNRDNSNIILYTDGSKNEQLNILGAGIYYTTNFVKNQSKSFSWNLGAGIEVFDAELFAIEKAFKIAWEEKQPNTENIWIFSDSQAAIKRLQNQNLKPGQYYIKSIRNWLEKLLNINIKVYLEWVPGHMNITGNELADKAAKEGTKLQNKSLESYISLAFIKRKIKEATLEEWENSWNNSTKKGRHYSQFKCKPKWKIAIKPQKKKIWSSYIQLKLGHGYFRSYLSRLSEYDSELCQICNTKENPEHLILHCQKYNQIRKQLKKEKELNQLSLKILFSSKKGQEFLFDYIKQTSIATREWLI